MGASMTTVSTHATAKEASEDVVASTGAPGAPVAADGARRATWGFVAVIAGALLLAWRVPVEIIVLGILLAGTAHVILEVRYVVGRFRSVLAGRFFLVVNAGLVVIVVCRLLRLSSAATIEVSILAGLLGLTVVMATSTRPRARVAGLAVVAAAAVFALTHTGSWFVVQAHLHNLVPAFFLWEWSARIGDEQVRRNFRAVTLAWVVAIPVLLLTGLADGFLGAGEAVAPAVETAAAQSKALGSIVPASATGDLGIRLVTAFAFAQVLHYYVWCVHFPRHDRAATASFEATPVGHGLRGWRVWAAIVAVTALVIGLALVEYRQGRTLYTSLASYHAYLEFPVLVALVLAWGARSTHSHAEPIQETTS